MMTNKKLLLTFLFAFVLLNLVRAQDWRKIETVEDVCRAYPEEMEAMLHKFDLNDKGLEKVKKHWEAGELVAACQALLNYYKSGSTAAHLRRPQPKASQQTEALADTILMDVFVVQNVRGQVPYGADGHRDWYYKGPNNDREWAWLSNRHSQINQVFNAYFNTGNPKYVEYIDLFLRDFIIKSMPYPAKKSWTSVWRGLEVSFRAKVWSTIFYGLLNNEYISPATQLLMLSSLPDHAHYNRNFHAQNNWLTMEISALATVATSFPEFKESKYWLEYSIATMGESMKGQVYDDGVQTELSSSYHSVSLSNFELLKRICDNALQPLPDFYNNTLEQMYRYIALSVRPNGDRILNNDSDKGSDRERIIKGAKIYNQPAWEYIATNGKAGTKPTEGPSFFFPWAGQLISRSGYDEDAHWSFFDVGPWGTGHQHNDKLHLSVAAYGRDLLVDAGRFAYTGEVAEKFRPYAKGSQAHNVLLIDGKGQSNGPREAEAPVPKEQCQITPEYDYARGTFDQFNDVEGTCKHTRRLYYERGGFWVVIDEIATDRPQTIEALWHFHPDCLVDLKGESVFTRNKHGNLQLIPVDEGVWSIKEVMGQEKPEIQGWYSVEYNKYQPNPTFIYSTKIESDKTFIWVLFPSEKTSSATKATIISKTKEEITLKVRRTKKEEWLVTIPL